MKKIIQIFHNFSLRRQLTLILVGGSLLIMILASISSSWYVSQHTRNNFLKQGETLVNLLSEQSKLALIYASNELAAEAANRLLLFPQVAVIKISDLQGEALYQSNDLAKNHFELAVEITTDVGITNDSEALANEEKTTKIAKLIRESDAFMTFLAPVHFTADNENSLAPYEEAITSQEEKQLLGHVYLSLNKSSLIKLQRDLIVGNLVALITSVLLFVFLIGKFAVKLTEPLDDLATAMSQPELGKPLPETDIWGAKEIIAINHAYNAMILVLKQREAELLNTRDEALQSAKLRTEFTANVSHELRTPLNGVLGMLELIEDTPLNEEQKEFVQIARSSGRQLLELINDILDFSKLSAGKMLLQNSDIDLQEVIEDILALQSNSQPDHHLAFICLYDVAAPRYVHADPIRLRQLFNNMIGNAVKFTSRGNITIEVTVTHVIEQTNHFSIAIKDTGIGMAQNVIPHIFDAYTQSDGSITRNYGGTGLGLGICKQLVELMGGFIDVKSELGKGTEFKLNLPLAQTHDNNPKQFQFSHIHCLILVQSPEYRANLVSLLTQWCIPFKVINRTQQLSRDIRPSEDSPNTLVFWDWQDERCEDFIKGLKAQFAEQVMVLQLIDHSQQSSYIIPEWVSSSILKPLRRQNIEQKIINWQKNISVFGNQQVDRLTFNSIENTRVLLVEDNITNQRVTSANLEKFGVRVDIANNGKEAVDACLNCEYHLIFMDCKMPVMDGFEATRTIRTLDERCTNVPIVALTANASRADRDKCLIAGMNDYLSKPCQAQQLISMLNKWVEKPTINDCNRVIYK